VQQISLPLVAQPKVKKQSWLGTHWIKFCLRLKRCLNPLVQVGIRIQLPVPWFGWLSSNFTVSGRIGRWCL